MRNSYYLLLTSVIVIVIQLTIVSSVEICECDGAGGMYTKSCYKCPKDCQKSRCKYFEYGDSTFANNMVGAPILMCKTAKSNNKNQSFVVNPDVVCDKPKVFYGCFTKIENPYEHKSIIASSPCNLPYLYKIPCSDFLGQVNCEATENMMKEFDLKSKMFNVYLPVTFDQFSLSADNTTVDYDKYWPNQINKEKNFYEKLKDLVKNKDKFEIDFIKSLVKYSNDAYDTAQPATLEGFTTIHNEAENIYAELGYDRKLNYIIVAFRGTSFLDNTGSIDLNNLWNDLIGFQIDFPGCTDCKVHRGFFISFSTIKNDLEKKLKALIDEYKVPVIYTGHSLGGAYASLAISSYNFPIFKYSSLITFGKPRVGNKLYSNYLNQKVFGYNFRVAFDKDPIPGVPFNTDYSHEGTEVFFTEKTAYVEKEKLVDSHENSINLLNIKYHSKYWELIEDNSLKFLE